MPSDKVYRGHRDFFGIAQVTVEDADGVRNLPPRLDLDNHSPTGLEWGYGGSGPAQLALAILADALGDDATAVVLHQEFKWKYIARLSHDSPWSMTATDVQIRASALATEIADFAERVELQRL